MVPRGRYRSPPPDHTLNGLRWLREKSLDFIHCVSGLLWHDLSPLRRTLLAQYAVLLAVITLVQPSPFDPLLSTAVRLFAAARPEWRILAAFAHWIVYLMFTLTYSGSHERAMQEAMSEPDERLHGTTPPSHSAVISIVGIAVTPFLSVCLISAQTPTFCAKQLRCMVVLVACFANDSVLFPRVRAVKRKAETSPCVPIISVRRRRPIGGYPKFQLERDRYDGQIASSIFSIYKDIQNTPDVFQYITPGILTCICCSV